MADKDEIRESDNSRVPSQVVTHCVKASTTTSAIMAGRPITMEPFTTLNEHLDIEAENSVGVKQGRDFEMKYYGIGIGGALVRGTHKLVNVPLLDTAQHGPVDQNMFAQIPFIARPLSDPLTPDQRRNLRGRTVENFGGIDYEFYYLKPIGYAHFDPKVKEVYRDAAGNEVPEDYVFRKSNLNPVPTKLNEDGSVPLSDHIVNGTGLLDLSLTAKDLEEIRNVCRIRFGDASIAALNEYAIYYSIESTTEGTVAGGKQRYAEAISIHPIYLVSERYARDTNANGNLDLFFDIGTSAPLLLNE